MDIEYTLSEEGIDADRMNDYAQQALAALNEHVDADLKEVGGKPGQKGALLAIGALVLKFVQTKMAEALVDVFKSMINRDSQLKLKMTRPDGAVLDLEADHVRPEQYVQTIALTEKFLKGGGAK
jgi:hypothetical protein